MSVISQLTLFFSNPGYVSDFFVSKRLEVSQDDDNSSEDDTIDTQLYAFYKK